MSEHFFLWGEPKAALLIAILPSPMVPGKINRAGKSEVLALAGGGRIDQLINQECV